MEVRVCFPPTTKVMGIQQTIFMKMKHICPYCENELWIEQKDIKPLSKKETEYYNKESKSIDSWKKEYTKTFFGKKKRKYSDKVIEFMKRNPLGKVKCFCGKESLINHNKKLSWGFSKNGNKNIKSNSC